MNRAMAGRARCPHRAGEAKPSAVPAPARWGHRALPGSWAASMGARPRPLPMNPPAILATTSHENYGCWYTTTCYYFRGNRCGRNRPGPSGGPFPLTLTLSLREREQPRNRLEKPERWLGSPRVEGSSLSQAGLYRYLSRLDTGAWSRPKRANSKHEIRNNSPNPNDRNPDGAGDRLGMGRNSGRRIVFEA